jgi:hypothetical protein
VNTQAGVDPAAGLLPVGVLLLPSELEGSHAQVGEGERSFRSFGLGGAPQELSADALKLLADIQFGAVEADRSPREAEQLALTPAQDQRRLCTVVR